MAIEINKEMQLAKKLIETTNENVFLTGNAGTGKTTFLNLLRTQTAKRPFYSGRRVQCPRFPLFLLLSVIGRCLTSVNRRLLRH